jgi:predicted ferric reductase
VKLAVLAVFDDKLSWYAARAGGMVAWALVTASIVWGLALSTRIVRRKGFPAWLLDLHRFLGTLSLLFVGVHLFAIWTDNFVHFGVRELFVPMASSWRPGAVASGVVATYLLVAIQLTSWAMRRLPRKLWHAVHMSSFPMFVLATIHGFTSGADSRDLAVRWVALTGILLVAFLAGFRLLTPKPRTSRRARPTPKAPVDSPVDALV